MEEDFFFILCVNVLIVYLVNVFNLFFFFLEEESCEDSLDSEDE